MKKTRQGAACWTCKYRRIIEADGKHVPGCAANAGAENILVPCNMPVRCDSFERDDSHD